MRDYENSVDVAEIFLFITTQHMSHAETSLQITQVPIKDLKPATYNPRKWDKDAVSKLTESIKRFGLVDPILVNGAEARKNIVIGGHFRLKVAKQLKFKTVPVVFLNIPDEEKEKELNLRLNRNTGEWDLNLLKEFDTDMLLDIGFDDADIQDIWADMASIDDESIPTDEIDDDIPAVAKPGDLFMLGEHRLLCGDSTDVEAVKHLMQGELANVIYCDPPYNIGLDYSKGVSTKGKYKGHVDDSLSEDAYIDFIKATMKGALQVAKEDVHVFYWCDQKYIWIIQKLYKQLQIENKRVCLWIKNNFNMTPKVAFNKAYEPCVYGTRGKPYLNDDVQNLHEVLNQNIDAGNQTIEEIMDLFDVWLVSRDPVHEYHHPTQKPTSLHEKPLKRCSKPDDIVLDLFGGSGSTLLACEQMHRKARLIEKDPHFCNVIIHRFTEMTGMKAKRISQGYGAEKETEVSGS